MQAACTFSPPPHAPQTKAWSSQGIHTQLFRAAHARTEALWGSKSMTGGVRQVTRPAGKQRRGTSPRTRAVRGSGGSRGGSGSGGGDVASGDGDDEVPDRVVRVLFLCLKW